MTKCLVLGATGFIGGHIARAAAARGWHVRAARRRPGATGAIEDLNVDWAEANLNNRASLIAAMQDCDVVFHAAAAYPHDSRRMEEDVRTAVEQMRNVLAAAEDTGIARLIFTSSFTTIGPPGEPGRWADERDFYRPGSSGDPYYESKWAMEVEALAAAQWGVAALALCPVAVFGPGDVHMSVSETLVMTARGRMPFYVDASLSVIDVRDVAVAHVTAVERGHAGERYILSAHNLTLQEGLAEFARGAGVRPPRIRISPPVLNALIAGGQLLPGSPVGYLRTMRLWQPVSNAKAVAELGLTTRPFDETVAGALAWFRARGVL